MRNTLALVVVVLSCTAVSLARPAVAAEDWPQWRGPQRDGHIPGFTAPKTWPKQLRRQWQVEVGEGHSSPVVEGDRVFVLSRQGDQEVARALCLADGKELWSQRYAAPFQMSPYATSHGKGPKSTPIVAGGRLYTLGIGGILSCWDAATGKPLWQHDFAKKYPKASSIWYGAATSPMVEAETLITFVGGLDEGALIALDCRSGRPRWQWAGDGAAYASPILVALDGTRQIVTQSQNACIGVAAGDGSLLWRLPLKTEYDQNIITPVLAGELLVFGGLDQPTAAYRLRQTAGKWSAERAWEIAESTLYMSTPVYVGGRLIGLANRKKGEFFCLDTRSGKTLWTSDGRMGDYAALLAAGDLVLAQTNGGELLVFSAKADRFQPVARYMVSDKPTWAHPAVVGKRILVKDETSLMLWTMDG